MNVSQTAIINDEHFYRKPEWFFANAKRYDNYPRTGAKIFAGEYAAQSDHTVSINNRNNWLTALSEAAFLTGIERNAAVVEMASYAPLFAHIDGLALQISILIIAVWLTFNYSKRRMRLFVNPQFDSITD